VLQDEVRKLLFNSTPGSTEKDEPKGQALEEKLGLKNFPTWVRPTWVRRLWS
jgi:hypothetical protein